MSRRRSWRWKEGKRNREEPEFKEIRRSKEMGDNLWKCLSLSLEGGCEYQGLLEAEKERVSQKLKPEL